MGNPLAGTYYENALSETSDIATVTINEDGSCSIIGTIGMNTASSAYDATKKTNFNILVKEWQKDMVGGFNTSYNHRIIPIVVNEPAGEEVYASWRTNYISAWSGNGTNVIWHIIHIYVSYNDDANYYDGSYSMYTTNYN